MAEKTIVVTGSKGGVGTTTVALNLAVQLANQTQKRISLIDLARPIGQVSFMLDMEPRFTVLDALERIDRLDELLLAGMAMPHKTGIEILAGPLHAPMKSQQRQSVTLQALCGLVEIANRAYDFVVVDIGVVNAAEWSAMLREAHTILLVAEPSLLALGMVEKHIAAAGAAGIDSERIRIVANRCRQNNDDVALGEFEKTNGREILSRLPNDYRQMTEAVKLGMPITGAASNPLMARYKELVTWIATQSDALVRSAS